MKRFLDRVSAPAPSDAMSREAKAANVRETLRIIVQARRAGVMLFARTDGTLGLKADQPPAGGLLAAIWGHRADIVALLPPPRVEWAKRMIAWLRARGFRPYLDGEGVLLIADALGRRRDVSWRLPIARVFDEIVAGLAEDPGLLDLDAMRAVAASGADRNGQSGKDTQAPASMFVQP
jgi:hypothetical protein